MTDAPTTATVAVGRRQATLGLMAALALAPTAAPAQIVPAGPYPKSSFIGRLVLTDAGDGRRMLLLERYGFCRPSGEVWWVPPRTVVDGASIPQVFWSLIGGPFEGLYRNASVIHDFYCDVRIAPWQQVHRVFYEGMKAAGVGEKLATTLYLAVYYGGPRWDEQTINNVRVIRELSTPMRRLRASVYTGDANERQDEAAQQERDLETVQRLASIGLANGGGPEAAEAAVQRYVGGECAEP